MTRKKKEMVSTKVQQVSEEISGLEKKRDAIIAWISNNDIAGHTFSAQLEKNLTNISIELQSLASEKNELVRESAKLTEQESIALERFKSLQYAETRKQSEEDCLEWVSRQAIARRKPGAGL
ncbi:MAG: hypothetical protein ACRBCJ_08600 [Hyphomicrobiaceae bacterium]